MNQSPTTKYHQMRKRYVPRKTSFVLLFESPPVSGKYFYNEDGLVTEPVFKAVMKLFDWNPSSKAEGLSRLKEKGVVLLDATYKQIDKMEQSEREQTMKEDYDSLVRRIRELGSPPILIGMIRVLKVIGERLEQDGFVVLNQGKEGRIPFPGLGHQNEFHELASKVVKNYFQGAK